MGSSELSKVVVGKYCKVEKSHCSRLNILVDDCYIILGLYPNFTYTYLIKSVKSGKEINVYFEHLILLKDEEAREYKLKELLDIS